MKILITGVTNVQTNHLARYQSSPILIAEGLRALGHEVEHRGVSPDEVMRGSWLDRFKRVIVYTAPLNDPYVGWQHGASCVLWKRPDAWLAFNDWQIHRVWSGFKTVHGHNHNYLWHSVMARGRKWRAEALERYRVEIEAEMAALASDHWKRRILVPHYPWGDVTQLHNLPPKVDQVSWVDPSSMIPYPKIKRASRELRAKRWVHAALGNQEKWLNKLELRWPIERWGWHTTRLEEHEVVQRYAENWGMFVPRYRSSRGWWRTRLNFAAYAGAVALPALDDAIAQTFPRAYGKTHREIEGMTHQQLGELARAQAKVMRHETWDRPKFLAALDTIIIKERRHRG